MYLPFRTSKWCRRCNWSFKAFMIINVCSIHILISRSCTLQKTNELLKTLQSLHIECYFQKWSSLLDVHWTDISFYLSGLRMSGKNSADSCWKTGLFNLTFLLGRPHENIVNLKERLNIRMRMSWELFIVEFISPERETGLPLRTALRQQYPLIAGTENASNSVSTKVHRFADCSRS